MPESPYVDIPRSDWLKVTEKLVSDFPLPMELLLKTVLQSWEDIYTSSFGSTDIKIGKDIFLPAQATGVILEKLIASRLHSINAGWRGGVSKNEKDIVCEENEGFCFEIKTSSSPTGLYGNRSTGHRSTNRQKYRTGYYLVINYKLPTETDPTKKIIRVRFGWIDDEDWVGQAQPTGQQASIGMALARLKLISIFEDT